MANIISGEDRAWDILSDSAPEEICRNSGAVYDPLRRTFCLESFGQLFSIDPETREIANLKPEGEIFLKKFAYFFRLSVLWYLIKAKNIMPAGRLVKPLNMPGGDIFFRGTHVLPLDAVSRKYAGDKEGFLNNGMKMGGKGVSYGDAAVELYAFPRIPVILILWLEDEEFSSRADLLFDSTACSILPVDILWSVAMMSALIFL